MDTFTCDVCNMQRDGSSTRYAMGGERGIACHVCRPVVRALHGLSLPADVLHSLPVDEGAVGQALEFIYDRLMVRGLRALADAVAERGMALTP